MLLRTLYDEKLAQASYLVGCQSTGEALIIDPNRDVEQYIKAARREGLRIAYVTETHIHADFVSGTRELAHATGAKMVLSGEGGADWKYAFANDENAIVVHDGDVFNVGNIRVQVMHTPGHTPEHIAFVLTDARNAELPMGIFSGDFVFVGDVGRPDLLEKAAGVAGSMRAGAHSLYASIQRFRELPDYLQVWPGHGAGSACGKALGAVPQSTVGYEKLFSTPFRLSSEEEFTNYILSGQPEPPKYFAQMKRINRDGPAILGGIKPLEKLDDASIQELIDGGMTVVDTRHAVTYGRGHLHGSINIPYNRAFPNWAGWLISYDEPFALIADERTVADVARDLALIGLDNAVGYFAPSALQGHELEVLESIPTSALGEKLESADAFVLDVRGKAEWEDGHIPGVKNIFVGYVGERSDELPRDQQIVLHCQSGSRSAIAASVLQSLGYDVLNVRGGFDEWLAAGMPVERATETPAVV